MKRAPSNPGNPKRAMALVIVLSMLVLAISLLIVFALMVRNEVTSATRFAASGSVRELASTALSVVQSQIIEGTRSKDAAGRPLAWAVQPGAIRTYNDQGRPDKIFKLYSAERMIEAVPNSGFPSGSDLPSSNWAQPAQRGVFTDLNAPVLVEDTLGGIDIGGLKYTARYPIVDPGAVGNVEGFSVNSAALGYTGNYPVPASYNPAASRAANPIPMPVRWLYVLADGTMVVPTGADAQGVVSFSSANPPTNTNPIVGRIAFWTDDNTARINLNTASEGVFWDRPWAATNANSIFGERTMAARIPAQNEFHRFPGHPAATSLSTVLAKLLPVTAGDYSSFRRYYDLAPRGAVGGTEAGTVSSRGRPSVALGDRRFFSSTDEFFFAPSPVPRSAAANEIQPADVEQLRFFLTTNSRAPEVNLWNLPRIGLWPIQQSAADRNPKDRLIQRATTIGQHLYHFTRATTWTGSASTASSQSPDADWAIPRNRELYRYLQRLSEDRVPGFGTRFAEKYAENPGGRRNRDQILTQMVDVIRAGLNTVAVGGNPNYSYVRRDGGAGERQIVPLAPPAGAPGADTKGFGRFFTITDVVLQFYAAGTDAPAGQRLDQGTRVNRVGALLLFNIFNPTPGQPGPSWDLRVVIEGQNNFRINGTNLDMGSGLPMWVFNDYWSLGQAGIAAFNGRSFFRHATSGIRQFLKTGPEHFPYFSQIVPVDPAAQTFAFTGGPLTIKIFHRMANTTTDQPIQEIRMNFPGGTFPKPELHEAVADITTNPIRPDIYRTRRWLQTPMKNNERRDAYLPSADGFYYGEDTLRGVQVDPNGPSRGDFRHIAALKLVDEQYFRPIPDAATYSNSSQRLLHTIRTGHNAEGKGGLIAASLVPNTVTTPHPAVAPGLNGALMANGAPGDWDSGPGIIADGAYVNKPDEGHQNILDDRGAGNSQWLGGYFTMGIFDQDGGGTFSPNRQVASGVVFGSLPTGVYTQNPWQTLLFTAQPAAGSNHPGRGSSQYPPDHIILDWFHMPIVEPYAISEPLSSEGKINMNYAIAPFSHIERSTGVRAVLKSTQIMAVPASSAGIYKAGGRANTSTQNYRYSLNLDETNGTLRGFQNRFATGDIFRSASEICTISLVPENAPGSPSYSTMETWWATNGALTGDNARESPYNHIYPRLTTKSNTFTVFYRVEALKKVPGTPANQWVEGRDQTLGEFRGSAVLERYVDAGATLPDFATNADATLDPYYRLRILSQRRFDP